MRLQLAPYFLGCVKFGLNLADQVFLTSAPRPGASGFKNSISVDQLAAEQRGTATRFPTLSLQVEGGNFSLSYTRSGVLIPTERSASKLYRRMFVQGNASEVQARVDDLRRGDSAWGGSLRMGREVGGNYRRQPHSHQRRACYEQKRATRPAWLGEWAHGHRP